MTKAMAIKSSNLALLFSFVLQGVTGCVQFFGIRALDGRMTDKIHAYNGFIFSQKEIDANKAIIQNPGFN